MDKQYVAESYLSFSVAIKPEVIGSSIYVLDLKITDILCFSTRTKNALQFVGVKTVADLIRLSLRDLYKIAYIGKKGRGQIIGFCESYDLKLSEQSSLVL
jgi:DNA-directed RNA polymerase alpha subunit